MTDTDKLKRLAEALSKRPRPSVDYSQYEKYYESANPSAILALIAENEALKLEKELGQWPLYSVRKQRDEAVALLVPLANMATVCGRGADDSVYVGQSGIRLTYGDFRRAFAFLARVEGEVK